MDYSKDFELKIEGKRGKIEIEPNILHRIDFHRQPKLPDKLPDKLSDCNVFEFEQLIAKEVVEKVDKDILAFLYEQYKNTDVDTLFILDLSRFKEFILKYLPIYLKEVE